MHILRQKIQITQNSRYRLLQFALILTWVNIIFIMDGCWLDGMIVSKN